MKPKAHPYVKPKAHPYVKLKAHPYVKPKAPPYVKPKAHPYVKPKAPQNQNQKQKLALKVQTQVSGDGIFKITGRGAECCTPTTLKSKYEHVDKRGPRPSDPWEGQNICRKTNKKGNFCAYPSGTLNPQKLLWCLSTKVTLVLINS